MREKLVGIYKITSPSNRIYIGQSDDLKRRKTDYNNASRVYKQRRLFASLNKYGCENHIFEILEYCEIDQLNNRERYYQDLYDVLSKQGLNCILTESDVKRRVWSEETKRKISESEKGKIVSDETRKKISIANKGRIQTEEQRLFTSKLHTGRKDSLETKLKRSGDNHWTNNTNFSEEHKRRISENSYMNKAVINTITKEIFRSCAEAERKNGYKKDALLKKLCGQNLNISSFLWLTDYERGVINNDMISKIYDVPNLILNVETGIYYEISSDAAKSANIKAATLHAYLKGIIKNKTNFIKV